MHRNNFGFARHATIVGRMLAVTLAASVVLSVASCSDDVFAPDGSAIDLAATPSQLAVDGDSSVVTALLTEADGRLVENGTKVTFVATGGGLCVASANPSAAGQPTCTSSSSVLPSVVSGSTHNGIATVIFRSGSTAGAGKVKARSAGISSEVNLTLSALAAPSGGKIVVDFEPDTVPVSQAASVIVFAMTADGSPVVDGTRVLLAASQSGLSRSIVLTHDGFARATFTGAAAGSVKILATSGTVSGEKAIVVR